MRVIKAAQSDPASNSLESPLYTELRILGLKADDLVNLMADLNKHRGAHWAKGAAALSSSSINGQGRR
jgi:hypothetical protein